MGEHITGYEGLKHHSKKIYKTKSHNSQELKGLQSKVPKDQEFNSSSGL